MGSECNNMDAKKKEKYEVKAKEAKEKYEIEKKKHEESKAKNGKAGGGSTALLGKRKEPEKSTKETTKNGSIANKKQKTDTKDNKK